MKYYKVMCKQGHCGPRKYREIIFYFKCKDAFEAMKRGQNMAGVKHTRLPISVVECSKEEYDKYHTSAYKRVI